MANANKALLRAEILISDWEGRTQRTPVVSSLHRHEISFSISRTKFPVELAHTTLHPTTQSYPQDEGIKILQATNLFPQNPNLSHYRCALLQ